MTRPHPGVLSLLAVGAGLSAANLYYNQPMLGLLASAFQVSPREIGLVPMATQAGYAIGILAFAPFGDKYDRSRVIVVKGVVLVAALLAIAAAPSFGVLLAGSLLVGLFATIAQDFVPAAAALAPAESRGRIVGRVMTGLLTGILLSRVFSGFVGAHFGWRAVYFVAAAAIALLVVASARLLPSFAPTTRASYGALLVSTVTLLRRYAPLRRAAMAQSLLAVAFSGFWSTLALGLEAPPFGLGSAVAGLFGVVGAAGAVGATVFGVVTDRRGPEAVIRLGAVLVVGSFVAMAAWPGSFVLLVAGALFFDLGTSATLIGHQTIIYGLDPDARSRVNAVLVTSMFLGMSFGAFAGSQAFGRWGWRGVCVLAAIAGACALLVRLTAPRTSPRGSS